MSRLLGVLVSVVAVLAAGLAVPAAAAEEAQGRSAIHFLVDTSGSMSGSKIAEAKDSLLSSATALESSGALVGLRQFSGSCNSPGTLLVPVGGFDSAAFQTAVEGLSAGGGTPTSPALRLAAQDFPEDVAERILVLIADGDDGCGDLCTTARSLVDEGVDVRIQSVGIQVGSSAAASLTCAAQATGGEYFSVDDLDDLSSVIEAAVGRDYDFNDDGLVRVANLGDSFASGEGLRGAFPEAYYDCGTDLEKSFYFDGTNVVADPRLRKGATPWPANGCQTDSNVFSEPADFRDRSRVLYENRCHRSGTAYGPRLWDALGVKDGDGLFSACSGAKAKNVGFAGYPTAQYPHSPYRVAGGNVQAGDLAIFSLGGEPDIITISIGGNDLGVQAGVSEVLKDCADKGCKTNKWEKRAKNVVAPLVMDTLTSLSDRYPESRVLVLGYPVLFGQPLVGCPGLSLPASAAISRGEREWLDETLVPLLNAAVRDAANASGSTYIDVYNELGAEHGICAEDSWINGLVPETFAHSGHPSQRWHQEVASLVQRELAASNSNG